MKALPRVDRICMHSYLPGLLQPGGLVLDLGANRGAFAGAMACRYGVKVHAMEPVPAFHERLQAIPDVQLHRCCLAPTDGQVELSLPEGTDATLFPRDEQVGDTLQVEATTLSCFFEELGARECDLMKLDVEGAELPALEQAAPEVLLRARQITVEFHDWKRPENSARVRKVKRRLRRLGFYCIRFSGNNGDVLFVRRDLLHPLQYLYLAFLVRNLRGAARLIRRWTGPLSGSAD